VSLETAEPECRDLDVTPQTVTASITLNRNCAECGETLKTAELELEAEFQVPTQHQDHSLSGEVSECNLIEEGGGRYAKSYFGAQVKYQITCDDCQGQVVASGTMSDQVAASQMEECC
jgi:hypothetical protein